MSQASRNGGEFDNSYYSNGSIVKQGNKIKKTLSVSSLGGKSCYADTNTGNMTRHSNSFMSCQPAPSTMRSRSKGRKRSKENSNKGYDERCSNSVLFEDSNVGTGYNSQINTNNNSHFNSRLVLVENQNRINTIEAANNEIFVDDEDSVSQSKVSSMNQTQRKRNSIPDCVQSQNLLDVKQ